MVLLVFCIAMAIGWFIGIILAISFFALLSQFFGAIGTLLGTFLALALLFIMLFSVSWLPLIRVAFYGMITGIIMSVIIRHEILAGILNPATTGNIICLMSIVVVLLFVIFGILYFVLGRYTVMKRKDIIFGFQDQTKKKKKR